MCETLETINTLFFNHVVRLKLFRLNQASPELLIVSCFRVFVIIFLCPKPNAGIRNA